jgi:hypothetical protein
MKKEKYWSTLEEKEETRIIWEKGDFCAFVDVMLNDHWLKGRELTKDGERYVDYCHQIAKAYSNGSFAEYTFDNSGIEKKALMKIFSYAELFYFRLDQDMPHGYINTIEKCLFNNLEEFDAYINRRYFPAKRRKEALVGNIIEELKKTPKASTKETLKALELNDKTKGYSDRVIKDTISKVKQDIKNKALEEFARRWKSKTRQ